MSTVGQSPALTFEIVAKCSRSKARVGRLRLPHSVVDTPVFMPVGTQGTLKGILPEQASAMGCAILLGNTYHLGHRPGHKIVQAAGGLHAFMNWPHSILTDSGGFQMVSLCKLMRLDEEGVKFESPHTGEQMLLTPEESIAIQNALGADIIMQLDDVVHVLTESKERVREAMERSIRWLDRCLAAHKNPDTQNLFPIVQGGLDLELRTESCREIVKRDTPGIAIGGLSGGEEKSEFVRVVSHCTDLLPEAKPRYCMGVGYAVDLVVCCALGVDMYDCVFPTRTARFGKALTPDGDLNLKAKACEADLTPIQADCTCATCARHSRAHLHAMAKEECFASLISIHNVCYQLTLMQQVRQAIIDDRFPQFIDAFLQRQFPGAPIPDWVKTALALVGL